MPTETRRRESKRAVQRIALAPLSPDERSEFVERQVVEYAEENQRAGHWSGAEAITRSREEISELLGDDPDARGHRFFAGIDHTKTRVGWIWIGPPPEVFHLEGAMWLYQITVVEGARGRGFGRGMLVALHRLLTDEGVEALHLNVFKWNEVARRLYDSLGYEIVLDTATDAGMRKGLLSPPERLTGSTSPRPARQ